MQQQQHQRTVAMKLGTPDDNINQLVKSDKVKVISQRFDWRRSSGSDNSVSCGASEQRQREQSERRHNKLNNHHHHDHHQRQLRHEQHRQQVADLKRNCNELQSVQYNKGTTAAAALVELVRQERANRRMSEPLDRSTNELIDSELARLNNLKLSDDLNYIVGSTQQHHQHQHQQRFLTGQIRAEHNRHQKSRTMIITSGNNNNNKTQQQAQGQQQAELMGTTTGEQVERPLVVVSAPSGPGDHRRQSPSLQQQQHGANESQHFDTSGENNNYYLSTSSDQLDSYHESRVDGAHNYVGQDAQQHNSHRSYQDTHDNYHHRTLDSDGGGGQYKNELFTSNDQHPQQHQASYVDLDELKINKQRQQQEQQQQQYHQVVLTDRNRIKSPPFLPESVIRVNSQATQRLPEASGSGAHEQFGESGQYSRGYLDDHAAHHHQHQLLSSSIDDDRYEHAHQQHHEHGHYHHQQHQQHHHHHHHHQQQQLTSLNTVQPSSLIRMRDGLKQSMDAHNYDQFASSSINSTYSNQNDDVSVAANLNQSFSGHHGPHSDHQTAATTTGGVSGLRHQQVLLPSSMPLVFDDSHEIIVIQGHDEQLSASGHYRGKTALSPLAPPSLAQQHDSLTSSAVGAASYTRLECSRPQQQQQQHHSNAGVDEFYNQSQGNDNRSSSGRGVNLIGGDTDGGGGRGGSGSRLSEPMDEFKVCEWQNCGNTFLDMDEFVHHLEMVHVNQEPREKNRYFCLWSNCKRNNQEFNARYKLLIHMRVHSGEKPYTCQSSKDCKKSFSRLENLKIHVRSHTGQKPYKCNYDNCSKSFTNSSDRIKHHKTHKDPKPYNCTYDGCTKRYTDPSSLRKHLRAHKRQYDGTSTSVTSTIVSGSSVFDTYNQSHAEDQLNLSYTSTGQQEQYYSGAIVSNQQSHLSSSSASVSGTYNQVHEPHQMTDYDHSKKEFESAYTASNIVYNQQAARYTDAGPTRSDATPAADHFDQSSGSGRAAPEFLDLDLQQHQQRRQQQQQPQGASGARETTFANISPERTVVSNDRYANLTGFRHINRNRNLRINEIRHQQLSRSWCAGGSSSLSPLSVSSQPRMVRQSGADRWQSSILPTQPPTPLHGSQMSAVGGGRQYQANNSATRQFVPMEDGQQWAPSASTSAGDAMSRSTNQLSSFANNDHNQLQPARRSDQFRQQQQQNQQQLRVHQHQQLMRSMPAGLPGARLSDTFFSDSSQHQQYQHQQQQQQQQQDFSWGSTTDTHNL